MFRKNVKLQELYKYKSTIASIDVDTEEQFQFDPFQKQNNERSQEKEFILKMKERRIKVEEVCSRYQKPNDGR